MSETSAASIGTSRGRYTCDGIPEKCWCEHGVVARMSKSEQNPGRRYFRCELAHSNKMVNDNHLFKWIDETIVFDVKKLKREVELLKEEIKENQKIMSAMYEKFEFDLLEANLARANMMKKMVFGVVCGFFIMFGISKMA